MNPYEQLAEVLAKVVAIIDTSRAERVCEVRTACEATNGADLEEFLSWFDE